jgi:ureidoglycolate lyase
MTTRTLKVQELDAENAAPYGTLVDTSTKDPAFVGDEFSFWNELAIDETRGPISVGMVEARPHELSAKTFERHTGTGELLAPLNGDVILVLGEPTAGLAPDVEKFKAFWLRAGSAMLLKSGTWHYAPMTEGEPVKVLVVFQKGTPDNDLEMHQIDEEMGTAFQVIA